MISALVCAFMIAGATVMLDSGRSTVHVRQYGIGEVPADLMGWIAIALGVLALVSPIITAIRQVAAGPAIGMDKNGVYVRPSLDVKRTQFLPWERIRYVAVRKMNGPNLCVLPQDGHIEAAFTLAKPNALGFLSGHRSGQLMAQERRMRSLGTNICVPIGGADKTAAEIVDAMRQWSAGRVTVSS